MSLDQEIAAQLKQAMLDRDSLKTETLKSIKSALLYESVSKGAREKGLSDEQELAVIKRESKKRAESVQAYKNAGNAEQAQKEQSEKDIIDTFLPEQMSEAEVANAVQKACKDLGLDQPTPADTGKIIGKIKSSASKDFDASLVAKAIRQNS